MDHSMDQHKEFMEKFLKKLTSSKTSPVISDDKYEAVLNTLRMPELCTHFNLKHWAQKTKKFQLMDLPGLGISDRLEVPMKESKVNS